MAKQPPTAAKNLHPEEELIPYSDAALQKSCATISAKRWLGALSLTPRRSLTPWCKSTAVYEQASMHTCMQTSFSGALTFSCLLHATESGRPQLAATVVTVKKIQFNLPQIAGKTRASVAATQSVLCFPHLPL